jgi:hypothetical protein
MALKATAIQAPTSPPQANPAVRPATIRQMHIPPYRPFPPHPLKPSHLHKYIRLQAPIAIDLTKPDLLLHLECGIEIGAEIGEGGGLDCCGGGCGNWQGSGQGGRSWWVEGGAACPCHYYFHVVVSIKSLPVGSSLIFHTIYTLRFNSAKGKTYRLHKKGGFQYGIKVCGKNVWILDGDGLGQGQDGCSLMGADGKIIQLHAHGN